MINDDLRWLKSMNRNYDKKDKESKIVVWNYTILLRVYSFVHSTLAMMCFDVLMFTWALTKKRRFCDWFRQANFRQWKLWTKGRFHGFTTKMSKTRKEEGPSFICIIDIFRQTINIDSVIQYQCHVHSEEGWRNLGRHTRDILTGPILRNTHERDWSIVDWPKRDFRGWSVAYLEGIFFVDRIRQGFVVIYPHIFEEWILKQDGIYWFCH